MWPRRTIASLSLVLQLSACYSWKPSSVTPEQTVQDARRIEVQLTDGSKVALRDPWISGDTLGGEQVVQDGPGLRDRGLWGMPLDSVAVIKTHRFNAWGTAGVVLVTLVVVGATATAIAVSSMDLCTFGCQ